MSLYGKYRPETFSEVIGQDLITSALSNAIDNSRISHAYLFSGPRGCGKTSCARILARCLNCAEGPTSHPCGKCESCRELGRNGSGSMDVMEIDAASHNSVDDARNLREQVQFSPVRDRYKVFILDEAHMISTQGFNALLKVVEEPPKNTIFIFATTAPEKVIPTIRSRTVHYSFRLVGPDVMKPYLAQICQKEGVEVDGEILDMVVRQGGGSVRDSLSVLEELINGREGDKLDPKRCREILGLIPSDLVSEYLEAILSGQSAKAYELGGKIGTFEPSMLLEAVLEEVRKRLVEGFSKGEDVSKLLFISEAVRDYAPLFKLPLSERLSCDLMTSKLLSPAPRAAEGARPSSGPAPAKAQGRPAFEASPAPAPWRAPQAKTDESDLREKWKRAVASLPEDVRRQVDEERVPRVDFMRSGGSVAVLLTFATPLDQHAFALRFNRTVPEKVKEAVQREFGPGSSIRPSPKTADGKTVTKVRDMSMEELAELSKQMLEEKPLSVEEIAEKVGGQVVED
ncbi:MAG: DNA polymerase III subunit gamma/tau [Aeriscardovia sp.]|nr:DNA polymerase III subunit gamma/tau [Aeriscardovia sp.]